MIFLEWTGAKILDNDLPTPRYFSDSTAIFGYLIEEYPLSSQIHASSREQDTT